MDFSSLRGLGLGGGWYPRRVRFDGVARGFTTKIVTRASDGLNNLRSVTAIIERAKMVVKPFEMQAVGRVG